MWAQRSFQILLPNDRMFHVVRPKKNKNPLANFILWKFAQILSVSVILGSIQTPIWHFKKKMRFQWQAGPKGEGVPEMWQGF
jgi:hypothetical protein